MTIVAIDCDLRKIFAVADDGRVVCKAASDLSALLHFAYHQVTPVTLLFEIASPVSFNRGAASSAAMYQLARWAIWNVGMADRLYANTLGSAEQIQLRVAPSNIWTKGYDLKKRHLMANATNKNKDLRECEAMLAFYLMTPSAWVPLNEYLDKL